MTNVTRFILGAIAAALQSSACVIADNRAQTHVRAPVVQIADRPLRTPAGKGGR